MLLVEISAGELRTSNLTEDDLDDPLFDNFYAAITEDMYGRGVDMQGINWGDGMSSRDEWRKRRIKEYINYQCVEDTQMSPLVQVTKDIKEVSNDCEFYTFKHAQLTEKLSIGHFQLRNLLWATSKNDVYYMYDNTVRHWSPHLSRSREVLNVQTASAPQNLVFTISSMACAENILFTGGLEGEIACKRLDDETAPVHYGVTANHISSIVNHINITTIRQGGVKAIVSSNDKKTRFINLDTMAIERKMSFPFEVNCSALSPDKQLLCVVGDAKETLIVDAATGKGLTLINEHHDFSFACCWSPDGRLFATGNQDKTARVYDIRYPARALHILGGKAGSIRSLQFTHDGRYLVAAEPIDFVHIFDASNFESSQVIDMFGEVSGVGITPEDQVLFIGMVASTKDRVFGSKTDSRIGGLFEFQRDINPTSFYYF
ncbi:WD40-repeat-containing domain protein [Dichotomocladium elegans]|nr:WD40-repeat-containing domain protein [Dichotomocladium elegans]